MASFLQDNEDLQYYLQEGIDWDSVTSVCELGYRSEGGWKSAAEALSHTNHFVEGQPPDR